MLYPEQKEDAYWRDLTFEQRTRIRRLLEATVEGRTDLVCADCGSPLELRVGKYGRFYGCAKYEATGCKGGISANDDGTPKGWPGDARTRAARKKLVELLANNALYTLERWEEETRTHIPYGFRHRYQTITKILGQHTGLKVAELTAEQCERAIEALLIFNKPGPRTRWDQMRLEDLSED